MPFTRQKRPRPDDVSTIAGTAAYAQMLANSKACKQSSMPVHQEKGLLQEHHFQMQNLHVCGGNIAWCYGDSPAVCRAYKLS